MSDDLPQSALPPELPEPEAFAALMAEYDRAIEHMTRSHEVLSAQVRTLSQEIELKNRLLERKERLAALGEMAAGVAHEIRNPLGGISLYLELLSNDLEGNEASQGICTKIRAAVDRLNHTVEAILGFTRQLQPAFEEVDVSRLFDEVVGLASREIEKKDLRVRMDIAEDAGKVRADSQLMHQLFLNLVRNAVEAAPSEGRVTLRALVEGDVPELRVEDEGAGIPLDDFDKLFTPFFTTKAGGTGLGLAFCQRIAEAHDASLRAENLASGGACFALRFESSEG